MAGFPMVYFIPISMGHQTSALAANSVIWAFRNDGTSKLHIRSIIATIGFDAMGPTPDSSKIGFYRFSGANFTGGTAIGVMKADTAQPASTVTDTRQSPSTALGQVGVTIESVPLFVTQNQRDSSATTSEEHSWGKFDGPILNPGEGLCVMLEAAGVVGDYIAGAVSYANP